MRGPLKFRKRPQVKHLSAKTRKEGLELPDWVIAQVRRSARPKRLNLRFLSGNAPGPPAGVQRGLL
jgi:hypothetical protein